MPPKDCGSFLFCDFFSSLHETLEEGVKTVQFSHGGPDPIDAETSTVASTRSGSYDEEIDELERWYAQKDYANLFDDDDSVYKAQQMGSSLISSQRNVLTREKPNKLLRFDTEKPEVNEISHYSEYSPEEWSCMWYSRSDIWSFFTFEPSTCEKAFTNNRPRTIRFIRLRDPSLVRLIPHHTEYTHAEKISSWYNGWNIKEFKDTRMQTAHMFDSSIDAGIKETDGICLRGCERYTKKGIMLYRSRRAILSKHLATYHAQTKPADRDYVDLAAYFRERTQSSADQAIRQAKYDEEFAKDFLQDMRIVFSALLPKVSLPCSVQAGGMQVPSLQLPQSSKVV